MDEKTLKPALEEFADQARKVAGQIRQRSRPPAPPAPPRPNSITWPEDMTKRPPDDLDKIEEQITHVAKTIGDYLER